MDEPEARQEPLDPPPEVPSPAAPLGLWEAIVWMVLVAVIVALLAVQQAPAPGPELESLELRLSSRYLLGIKTLAETLDPAFASSLGEDLLRQLEAAPPSPGQRVSLVALTAELAGPERALERLAAMRGDEALSAESRDDLELLARFYGDPAAEIPAARRDAFRSRHGWLAELALSYGQPAADPGRRAVLRAAIRTAVTLLLIVGGGLLVTAVGLALLPLAGFRRARGGLLRVYPRSTAGASARRTPYLETVVLVLVGGGGASLVWLRFQDAVGETVQVLFLVAAVPAVVLVMLWPRWRGLGWRDLAMALGYQRGRGLGSEIGSGLVAYVAGMPILVLGMLLALALSLLLGTRTYHPIVEGLSSGDGWQIAVVYLVACGWAPVVEESLFRGYFYHYLRGRAGVLLATALVSVVFAVLHPQGLIGVPPLVALATVLTLIREWRGSLIASMTVHAVHNALALTAGLLLLA